MLPKIVVSKNPDREVLRSALGLVLEKEIAYEASEAKIGELRGWVNFAANLVNQDPSFSLVIWDSGSLKADLQAILLKPFEEKKDFAKFYLITDSESKILSTLKSRCEILFWESDTESVYWKKVLSCWRSGPGEILLFTENNFKKEEVLRLLFEVLEMLGVQIRQSFNETRYQIYKKTMKMIQVLNDTQVNPRLLLEEYLLTSWRTINLTK